VPASPETSPLTGAGGFAAGETLLNQQRQRSPSALKHHDRAVAADGAHCRVSCSCRSTRQRSTTRSAVAQRTGQRSRRHMCGATVTRAERRCSSAERADFAAARLMTPIVPADQQPDIGRDPNARRGGHQAGSYDQQRRRPMRSARVVR